MGPADINANRRSPVDREALLATLTASQREAVLQIEGPQLIIAGPGSGKTRVVTHRIAHMLLEGIADDRIVALTFTNKAADEMRRRLETLFPRQNVWMGTFHRFCSRQLRRYASLVGLRENYTIYDADDSRKLLREAINDSDVKLVHETPGRIAAAISWAKNDLISPDQYKPASGDPLGALVARIYPHYQRRLLAANAVDFDDLLMQFAILLRDNSELRETLDEQFQYIMVDEYQDTNLAQYAIVRALSVKYPNLSVTGDPDQSIYGWRGATIRNILEFERDFERVHVVKLEQNFRSTQAILRAADQLISHNVCRKEKALYTDKLEGKPVRLVVYPHSRDEADAIAAHIANQVSAGQRRCRDFAIFYRTNALSRSIERSFRSVSIPYQIVRGLEFYQRKEVKDVLAYLQLLNNPANDVAFLRIVNTPARHIGRTTLQRLTDHARQHGLSLMETARQAGLIESLSKRSAVYVASFVALIDSMQLAGDERVETVMRQVLEHTGYRESLEQATSEDELQRLDNLDELLTDAREFDEMHTDDRGLDAFLEQASLVADIDDWESSTDCVTMMTLHAAKGLEFPVVLVVGVEEELLPHWRSREDPSQLEEERRLLFVGMTRAQEELQLSVAQKRALRGSSEPRAASRFLLELPQDEIEVVGRLGYSASEFIDDQPCDLWDDTLDDMPDDDEDANQWCSELDEDDSADEDRDADEDTSSNEPSADENATSRAGPQRRAIGAKLTQTFVTAADMASDTSAAPVAPESFRAGMVVMHPEYGIGKIVSVSGRGAKRSAAVRFATDACTRSFRLAFSPLKPVRSGK